MSSSTRSARALLDALEGRWPATGGASWNDAVGVRLGALLDEQPEQVADRIREALVDPASEAWARTAIWALEVAASQGLRTAGWLGEDRLHLIDAGGRSMAVALLGVDVPAEPAGDPEALERLRLELDKAFGERRYVLWLRRSLPARIDARAIGRAVMLWLNAIDRGEWHGNHAIYEDEGVELELVLTDRRGPVTRTAELLRIEPVTALERLSAVDTALVERVSAHDEDHGDVPLVVAIGATAPWRLPRGFAEQLLYGTADFTRTETDPPSYEAAFHASGRSLFSDPLSQHLSAVWWLEPGGEDPLSFSAWSLENPWARCPWTPEPPPGPRFHRVGREEGSRGRAVDVMRWSAPLRGRR